jgi:hypothetical protein
MTTRPEPSVDLRHGPLRVSENGRYLVHADGSPFFWLGDTAWELFHALDRAKVDGYLADRANKRFTVIQAVILAELNGLTVPNANGDLPLHDLDPRRPNEAYFQHVDYVVDRAEALGLYMGLLPTWGSWVVEEDHPFLADHRVLTPETAEPYGRFLGERYGRRPNVLWILGGDRVPDGYVKTWRALAAGIESGAADAPRSEARLDAAPVGTDVEPLMTYHPRGGRSSGEALHQEEWLDLNMIQSGHRRDAAPWVMIDLDYRREPVKPVVNGEPGYEGIPGGLKAGQPKLTALDVRRFAYWSIFAGACGHTYGANEIWQMWDPAKEPVRTDGRLLFEASTPWHEALDYVGAGQMQHLRALVMSRPVLSRIPDQDLVAAPDPAESKLQHIQATRSAEGTYALVYIPAAGQPVTVRLDRLAADEVIAWWYDPRTGEHERVPGAWSTKGERTFTTPTGGPDWVLVLDDAAQGFTPPGQGVWAG